MCPGDMCPGNTYPGLFVQVDRCPGKTVVWVKRIIDQFLDQRVCLAPAGGPKAMDGHHLSAYA